MFGTPEASTDKFGQPTTELPVTVANRRPEAADYIIIFDAVDTTGKTIAQNSVYTMHLGARRTQEYKSTFYNLDPSQLEAMQTATFKITSISEQ